MSKKSGKYKIGDDWPGYFICGQDCVLDWQRTLTWAIRTIEGAYDGLECGEKNREAVVEALKEKRSELLTCYEPLHPRLGPSFLQKKPETFNV